MGKWNIIIQTQRTKDQNTGFTVNGLQRDMNFMKPKNKTFFFWCVLQKMGRKNIKRVNSFV